MPSFQDSIVLFVIALLLFGPKKLPVLARELGKWIGEFRRASNEFKMQMEDELRAVEQADRQKQIAAMEAAAPIAPALADPEHPHLAASESATPPAPPVDDYYEDSSGDSDGSGYEDDFSSTASNEPGKAADMHLAEPAADASATSGSLDDAIPASTTPAPATPAPTTPVAPLPIATSGDLHLMPPATGLPVGRSGKRAHATAGRTPPQEDYNSLGGLFDSIPSLVPEKAAPERATPENTGAARSAESTAPTTSSPAAAESSPALVNAEVLTESETHAG